MEITPIIGEKTDLSATYLTLGEQCVKTKQYQQALLHFIKATLFAPQNIAALIGCARVLLVMDRPAESSIYSERALALSPHPLIFNLHGQALYQMGNYTDALGCFFAESDNPHTLGQRALCLTQLSRYEEAMEVYQQALKLNPNDPMLQSNYAFCLLALGDLLAGFQAFEWRWQHQLSERSQPWRFPPSIDRAVLRGKSILIRTEQGFGDSLQFFRYIPRLVERGACVILEIQPRLIPILSSWSNQITLIATGSSLPICDYHFSIMSLAFVFKTTLQSIPNTIPYLFSEPAREIACRQRLEKSSRKRIGIMWRGSSLNQLNHKRSMTLHQILMIKSERFDFICLQQDVTHDEKKLLDEHGIFYFGLELSTFEGTAALISCLDVVVTIDTSIAHLAGGMGKPVWILLPWAPDWRWLLDREDSPWYPTARLFRQTTMGDWQHPLARIKTALETLSNKDGGLRVNIDHASFLRQALKALEQNNLVSAIQWMQQAAQAGPTIAMYRRNLGELLRRAGRLDDAILSHQRAIDLEPNSAENHFHLGLAFNDNRQYELAVTHYRTALSLDLNYGFAWNNLGASLECLGDTVGAQKAYLQAIELNPDHAEARNNLGAIYCEQGRIDDAREHFAAAIKANPDFVEAHYNLSSLKTYDKDDPHLLMLESLTQKALTLNENARIRYYFALGKALDDTAQFKRAFQAYAEGNRLKYGQEPWNDSRLQGLTQAIKALFIKPYLKKARKTKDSRRPIFIVGMPRSGTTLLEQILASHERVFGAGELSILDEVIHSARGASQDMPFTTWVAQLTDEEYENLGHAYLERTWELAPDKTYITDKMPGNCFYIGMIYRMFPEAKIIHARRNPMDTCFSCFTKLFKQSMPFSYHQDALGRYFVYYAEIMKHWHRVLPQGVILDLPYERMVTNQEKETKKLLDFIGLPWDPNCLEFYNHDRLVKTASVAQVRKPIYQTSVKRWEHFRAELSPLAQILSPYCSTYDEELSS